MQIYRQGKFLGMLVNRLVQPKNGLDKLGKAVIMKLVEVDLVHDYFLLSGVLAGNAIRLKSSRMRLLTRRP